MIFKIKHISITSVDYFLLCSCICSYVILTFEELAGDSCHDTKYSYYVLLAFLFIPGGDRLVQITHGTLLQPLHPTFTPIFILLLLSSLPSTFDLFFSSFHPLHFPALLLIHIYIFFCLPSPCFYSPFSSVCIHQSPSGSSQSTPPSNNISPSHLCISELKGSSCLIAFVNLSINFAKTKDS